VTLSLRDAVRMMKARAREPAVPLASSRFINAGISDHGNAG
jgi:hypothetical protein